MRHLLTGALAALALAAPVAAQDAAPATPQDGAASAPTQGTASATPADPTTVLATVNGTEITLGHMIALRGRLPEQYQTLPDDVLYQGLLDQLIQQQILADAATRTRAVTLGLENESRAYVAGREIERLSRIPLDEDAVQAAYEDTIGSAPAGTEFNASHILVETEEEARTLREELASGADFATVAQEYSTGPTGPNGGELGWFGPGMMVPEFEAAVTGLEPGEISEPVQTQFGWHVIRLNETRETQPPALEEVRPQIEAQLRDAAVATEIERLSAEADVTRAEVEVDPAAIRDDTLLEN